MTGEENQIILLTRADDMGYTHTGNLAILECMRHGIIRSAAMLVISPWFEEAAAIARENPDLCFGVHLGIIAEWVGYRWRPALPYSEVRSLVDEDGYLWRSPREFWDHNPSLDELEREFRAQVALARKKGVRIDYLDTHYIMPYDEHFRPIVERIGKSFGVPVSCLLGEHEIEGFGIHFQAPEEKERALEKILRSLTPGVHLLITHPGFPSLENDALLHSEVQDRLTLGVGRNRAAEAAAYMSLRIGSVIDELGIRLMSYREFSAGAVRPAEAH